MPPPYPPTDHDRILRAETRLEGVEESVAHLDAKVDERFERMEERVDERFERMAEKLDERFDAVLQALSANQLRKSSSESPSGQGSITKQAAGVFVGVGTAIGAAIAEVVRALMHGLGN